MNATDTLLATAAATFGNDVSAFRSAAVTSENKGNVAARSLLASLVSGVYTEALAVSAILHAFGNPKSEKGKPLDKLSGSGDYLTGFGAVRKMAATVFGIFANIDADKAAPEGVDDWSPAIRPLLVSFILNEKDAPKSLRALDMAVKAALRDYAKAIMPDNSEAVADNAEQEGDKAAPEGDTQSLSDRVLSLMVAYEAASHEDKAAAHEALSALFDMVNADVIATGDIEQEDEYATN